MRLFLDIGHCDRSVKRGFLEGRTMVIVSEDPDHPDHGALLACAEGIAHRPDAERAAKAATTALGDAYYMAVESDAPRSALEEASEAANLAVRTGGERGRAAVLGGLVLRERRWIVSHVGNVRIWRYRDQQIKQLTRDHLAPRALQRTEVTRACGFHDTAEFDCDEGTMEEGDVFLISSPGVHEALNGSAILSVLQSEHTAQQMAELLTQRAIAAHAGGYVGACVARVEKLPPPSAISNGAMLPLVALPKPGEKLDGFVIEKPILKNPRFRLYRAEDRESGERVTLRFPDPDFPNSAQVFLREERMARRIESPFILRPVPMRQGRRTALYSAIEYRRTENLENRIRRKHGLPLAETLPLAEQLLAALETLHGQGMIHHDVRARNLFYDKFTRQLWVLGFGVNSDDTTPVNGEKLRSSTLSYWAPELFDGAKPSERTDVYAAGVTIYRMLAAEYPYGKIRSREDRREVRTYKPLRKHNATLPSELDGILERACAPDPEERYSSAARFTAALGAVRTKSAPEKAPAYTRGNAPTTDAYWPWWLASALTAGLVTYLYFALR